MIKISFQLLTSLSIASMIVMSGMSSKLVAQDFVEYPSHGETYGDHNVPTQWTGGPSAVTLELETDPMIQRTDGMGQAQYTAQRPLTFVDDGSPQNFDNLDIIDLYGSRLPLLLHFSANGTSTLIYGFANSVNQPVDLFIADVDSGDDVTVRAFDSAGNPIDMSKWTLAGEGDLSLIKNTGAAMSAIVAPVPTTVFSANGIRLTPINNGNFNRSYSILRSPENADLGRIEVEFTGLATNTSAHIYVALATAVPGLPGDVNLDGTVSLVFDLPRFIAILSAEGYQPEADIDLNGVVDFIDIGPFIDILSGRSL